MDSENGGGGDDKDGQEYDPDKPDQPQFINEEGDYLEGQNDDFGEADAQDDGFKQEEGAGDAQPEIELGFEEATLEEGQGFGSFSAQKQQSNLRDMFKTHQMKRFDAAGGVNQEIRLNSFAIRKQVDVKRLKFQLWDTMDPILTRQKE